MTPFLGLLRSNQPVAWLVVPAAVACWAVWALATGTEIGAVAVRAVGAVAAAGIAHRMYAAYAFVPRADPMVSLFLAWMVCAAPADASTVAALRGTGALWALLGSADQMLRMHRQASASGIGFRAGVLAGCAAVLEPGWMGGIAALYAAQTLARPFLLREWLMTGIGAAWPMVLASGAVSGLAAAGGVSGIELLHAVQEYWWPAGPDFFARGEAFAQDLNRTAAGAGLAVLALGGWVRVLSARRSGGLRAESTRLHTFVFSLVAAAAAAVWPSDLGVAAVWRAAAVWCAFGLAGGAPEVRHVGRAERVLWWLGGGLLLSAVFAA